MAKKRVKKKTRKSVKRKPREPVVYTGITRLDTIHSNIDVLKTKMEHYGRVRAEYEVFHSRAEEKTSQVITKLEHSLKLISYLERHMPRVNQVEKERLAGPSKEVIIEKPVPKKVSKKTIEKKVKKVEEKKVVKRKPGTQEFVDRIHVLKTSFDDLKKELESQRQNLYSRK